jgi:anhydro-N-acetylmuramic acid kinase
MNGALYVGVMSGTSADGIDACLVRFRGGRAQLHDHIHQPYPDDLRRDVLAAMAHADLPVAADLDVRLADAYAATVTDLLAHTGTSAADVRAVGCHGQTVFHRPQGPYPTTIQLGDPHRLAVRLGIDVVADFRRADLAAGGQGAPLAPAFHAAAFSSRSQARAVINLGGIANVTLLPAGGGTISGFDTGPASALMDGWIQRHRGERYDRDGAWAATGRVDAALLERLLSEPYFAQTPPKSTGRELFNLEWLDARLPTPQPAPANVQATLSELTARSIALAVQRHGAATERLLLCGGGAYNTDLRTRLQTALPRMLIDTTAALGIAPEQVEPVAFAWLAHRRVQGKNSNRPEVTGADRPLCLGALIRAPR